MASATVSRRFSIKILYHKLVWCIFQKMFFYLLDLQSSIKTSVVPNTQALSLSILSLSSLNVIFTLYTHSFLHNQNIYSCLILVQIHHIYAYIEMTLNRISCKFKFCFVFNLKIKILETQSLVLLLWSLFFIAITSILNHNNTADIKNLANFYSFFRGENRVI